MIGGVAVLGAYCADDYVLGQRIHAAGKTVVLSHKIIDHLAVNRSLKASLAHQLRWMRSTRFSRPWGHVGAGLTFAMPFGASGPGHCPHFMGTGLSASLSWAWPSRIAWCNAWWSVGLDFATVKPCGGAGYTRSAISLASVYGVRVLPAAKSCGEANTTCSAKADGCGRYDQFRAMLFGAPESIAPPSKGLMRMQGVTPRTVRWLVLGGAVIATSFAAMRLLRSSAPEVAVARVQFGELESWITTNGVVEPREPYVIRAPVGAFVVAVQSVEGRKVRRGDSLLTLDVAAQRADLARAREELVKAQNAARVLEAGPAGWRVGSGDERLPQGRGRSPAAAARQRCDRAAGGETSGEPGRTGSGRACVDPSARHT